MFLYTLDTVPVTGKKRTLYAEFVRLLPTAEKCRHSQSGAAVPLFTAGLKPAFTHLKWCLSIILWDDAGQSILLAAIDEIKNSSSSACVRLPVEDVETDVVIDTSPLKVIVINCEAYALTGL